MGLQGSVELGTLAELETEGHGIGLGTAPHDVVVPLEPLPPEDKLRLPNEDDRVDVSSSGELSGEDMATTNRKDRSDL